jgi:hypothetical protein
MITATTALPFYVNEVLLSFLPVLKDLKFVVCLVSVEDYQPHRQCKYYCAVDCGFKIQSGRSKDDKNGICCFFPKHASLRRKSKD